MKKYGNFNVSLYGGVEKFNDVLSKTRCRIFYKYGNRNGTYITDEFAEKLLSTIAYVPVKGIYNDEEKDFTDHGMERNEGKIYGIVPETHNLAWERHLDEDGVEREYACVDVLLFTTLYEEAQEIIGKGQSMELFEGSLRYHGAVIKGQKWIVFDEGSFLGLQALGDNVEPCFEGAAFYSLKLTVEEVIAQIKEYSIACETYKKGGKEEMKKLNFKVSDREKFDAIWALLNTRFDEEFIVDYSILDVYDGYALCYDHTNAKYVRVKYEKNDAEDSVVLGEFSDCFIVELSAEEKDTVEVLRKINGDTFELVKEGLENFEATAADLVQTQESLEEEKTKYAELEVQKSELEAQVSEFENSKVELEEKISGLNEELSVLIEYKNSIEKQEKLEVISGYATSLSEEIIKKYTDEIENFTKIELDKELAYELKNSDFYSNYSKSGGGIVPPEVPKTGLDAILEKYKK